MDRPPVPTRGISSLARFVRSRRLLIRSPTPPSGGSHATPGNVGRGIDLSQWLPTQLNKGLARGGVGCAEVEDIGQDDEDRIAPLDVFGRLPRTSKGVSEQHRVTGRDRLAVGQGHDRPATATTLDFRDPFFARREGVHQGFHTGDGVPNDAVVVTRAAGGCPHHEERAGTQTERRSSDWSGPVEPSGWHDLQAGFLSPVSPDSRNQTLLRTGRRSVNSGCRHHRSHCHRHFDRRRSRRHYRHGPHGAWPR